jgi:hypothetical protein
MKLPWNGEDMWVIFTTRYTENTKTMPTWTMDTNGTRGVPVGYVVFKD